MRYAILRVACGISGVAFIVSMMVSGVTYGKAIMTLAMIVELIDPRPDKRLRQSLGMKGKDVAERTTHYLP